LNLKELNPKKEEEGDTKSLIRGIAARFKELGYNVSGFNAVMTSDVLPGSGLSSSASVEILIGNIFNMLFNNGTISNEELAIIGQYAENNYFGKPCGLMDQMACSVGGIIAIDFENNDKPIVEKIDFNFQETKYNLIVVDTGGNHTDLTEDYSSIPAEMKSVANYFGKSFCREITYTEILENISQLRVDLGDRAVLRALHFIEENERVVKQVKALKEKNFTQFMTLIKESGNSSFKWLQNIYTTKNIREQGLSLALAITENFIKQKQDGVCRVHGGGFAGTIQAFISKENVKEYIETIEKVFGKGSAIKLSIRSEGAVLLSDATTI
jgi:galactokinase